MNRSTMVRAAGRGASSLIGLVGALFLCALILPFPAASAVNVTQFHNHLSRDGIYVDPAFTPANAAALVRDTNFNGTIAGSVYAQPLYIEGGPQGRPVIIAVTESNYVYSLDAIYGTVVWHTNVATAVSSGLPCGDISPYGITGTPVVDLPSRALFFDAVTENPVNSTVEHLIYSLNVDTGALNPGWPVSANGMPLFGTNVFNSLAQGQRGALSVISGNVYVPYGGLDGDCGTYFGVVIGVPLTNPGSPFTWSTSYRGGGIWAVGGVASDGTDPFVATGNTFSPSTWSGGESVLHLSPGLTLSNGAANYWAPTNWLSLDNSDLDIGGSGPLLVNVPGATPSNLVVALGKDKNMYLLNQYNLGGITTPLAQAAVGSNVIIQAAATYQTAAGVYVVLQENSVLRSFLIGPSNPPSINAVWSKSEGGKGSPFVTTTDGTNNMIVWGIGAESSQRLTSFNGDTGAAIYTGGGNNELMAGTHRFSSGIVARGRVYVGTDNKIYAFQAPGQTISSIDLSNPASLANGQFQFTFTNLPGALFSVFSTTNLYQAGTVTNWNYLGDATEVSQGQFQFTDTLATNFPQQFYSVVSP